MCMATPIIRNTPVIGNNSIAGNDYNSSCGGSGPDVVYRFSLSGPRTVTVTTCSANTTFDTVISILSSCNPIVSMTCNDQSSCVITSNHSTISGVVLPAGNYWVVVDGWISSSIGNYELLLTY
jgi:hypothetical protein